MHRCILNPQQVPETILEILDYQNVSILLMVDFIIEFHFVLLVSLDLYSTFLEILISIDKS